jgi:hypothetical protein
MRSRGIDLADTERKLRLPGHGNRVDHDALFSGSAAGPGFSPARLWRMSPHIYASLIPKISGLKQGTRGGLLGQPFSSSSAEGIKDYDALFVVDEPTIAQLLRNAHAVVDYQTSKSRVKEFGPLLDPEKAPAPDQVRSALRRQFQIALFRDPAPEEADRFVRLYELGSKDAGARAGARTMLAAVLMLPEAIYRFELGAGARDAHGRRLLSPRELAYALGFALGDEGPDGALLEAAEAGRLAGAEDVRRELRRMLDDPKLAKPRILRFFEEYFEYPAALDVFKDLKRGEWRPEVLVNDTRRLVEHVLARDRDVLRELLTTNLSYVNYSTGKDGPAPARIANKPLPPPKDEKEAEKRLKNPKPRQMEYSDLYNLPEDWTWTAEQPLELPRAQRAGILTQPSWLAAFATNDENHAIRRGKWIRERLLGGTVPDLPITVDAQLPDTPEKTLRERMEITRKDYCWRCHRKMNPLGLAFEAFDYVGRRRDSELVADLSAPAPRAKSTEAPARVLKPAPLDTTGAVEGSGDARLDGPVKDAVEMIHRLAGSARVRQVFVRHAFRYWMGRNETLADGPALLAADRAYVDSGGSMKALIVSLLSSDPFLYRK